MTQPDKTVVLLAGKPVDETLQARLGELDLGVTRIDADGPFDMLDDFNGTTRTAGQLLIKTGRTLFLIDQDQGVVAQPVDRSVKFVSDMRAGPVKAALHRVSPLRSLLLIGSGTICVHHLSLTDDDGKTQARARLTTLVPTGAGTPVTVATVQGVRGYDDALAVLRDHLQASAAPVATPSRVLFPDRLPHVAKPAIPLTDDRAAWAVAGDIIAAHLDVARRNEAGVIADHDTEFLHHHRVALRKVRSVVSLFKGVYSDDQTQMLKRAASDLMAPTGRLRDLDVYLLARDDYFAMIPTSLHAGLSLMFAMFEKERRLAQRRMAARLNGAQYANAMSDLQALFRTADRPDKGPLADQPFGPYARGLIRKRYRKVCRIARTITDDTPDDRIHELRIACKKLRYLMEFTAPLLPPGDIKPVLRPLKRLQDNLGLFNDYSVQQGALHDFMQDHEPIGHSRDLILAQSIGALIAVLHDRQAEQRARVTSSFACFDSPAIRARFRTLFPKEE
ncbi:CHAD domain-containing protein [Paracoccus sp. Ld10]|uniref:CHAD domain-containing protein n=1 Tax=Paracoccus sp. Ld10 TaxID=649158 RepID=UPI00386D07C2